MFSDPIWINEMTHSFLILSMRHCCTCFNLYTEFQIFNFYVNLQISTSLGEQSLQPSPPRFRVSASLGREQTRAIRPTVGRKEGQAFTSCVKDNNDVGTVGVKMEGGEGTKGEGDNMGSQVEAALSCSVAFHKKTKATDLLFKSKKIHSFCLKKAFEAHLRRLMRIPV